MGAFFLLWAAFPVPAQEVSDVEVPLWIRDSRISPDGKTIVFTYQGDIYTVPVEGGDARRITSDPRYDHSPIWSPDGGRIAFASDREGSLDIYVVDKEGGNPLRLTTRSSSETPLAFTGRGTVLYASGEMPITSSMLFPESTFPQVYEVSVQGGRPVLFSPYPMAAISLNPDGSLLYQDIKGYEDTWRKHHTSSVTRDIWLLKDGKHTRLTTFKGEDMNPVWAPDYRSFYYLSEENGSFNVYKRTLDPNAVSVQISFLKTHPVRFLSVASDGTLCFTYNGELYTMREGSQPKKVAVRIVTDNATREVIRSVKRSGATEIAVSPKQEEVAFVLGGDVYVTSVEYATTKRITNTPATERSIDFSPDGRSIVYASERDSVWQVYRASLVEKDEDMFTYASRIEEENLTCCPDPCFQPLYSPDGEYVAFLRNRTEICAVNLKNRKIHTIMDGKYEYSYQDGDQSYCWSPDSRWIMTGYIGVGGWMNKDLALVKADGSGERHNLTNSGYSEMGGKFVLGGKAMIFMSDRSGYRSHGSWGAENDIYITFFDKAAYEKFLMDKEGKELLEKRENAEKTKKEKKEEEKKEKDSTDGSQKVEPLQFELDYLEERTLRLTSTSDFLVDMALTPKGDKLFYIAPHNGKWALWCKDLVESKTEMKLSDVGAGSLIMDKDGANLYILSGGSIKKISTATWTPKVISYESVYEDRPFAQREYLFRHIWRQVKDKFYDPTIRNMDWKALYDNYERFLPHINNGYDFSEMASELLGELNASHTGCRYYVASNMALMTASLGVFTDPYYQGDGLKIVEILHNSPLDLAGKEIRPGDLIVAIDGHEIKAGEDYYPLLEGKIGESTRLTLKPAKGKRFDVVVKLISSGRQNELLYERWVKRNARIVDSLSQGRVAYVHIKGMDSKSFRTVYRQLFNEDNRNREAVIIDTRNNGGGWLHDDVATLFSGKRYARFAPRGQYISDEPYGKWTKPSCMLVSENNYSDAHGTPWVYQQLKIGKLIGAPVPGTMTAVWWESLPGGYVFGIPEVGVLDDNDEYIENQDLIPDVVVYNTPETLMQGRDLQLEKAVEEMLKEADGRKAEKK